MHLATDETELTAHRFPSPEARSNKHQPADTRYSHRPAICILPSVILDVSFLQRDRLTQPPEAKAILSLLPWQTSIIFSLYLWRAYVD